MKKLDEILDMCPNFYDRESFANGYLKGYNQAEKDLELSWEDIKAIDELILYVDRKYSFDDDRLYKEVLERFKERKER